MKKICFIFNKGRKNIVSATEKGSAPADFFYGALELKKKGHDIGIIEGDDISRVKVGRFLNYCFRKIFGLNLDLILSLNRRILLDKLNGYNVIIATTNSYGLALAVLKFFGRLKSKIIFISMGVLPLKHGFFKKYVYGKLFKNVIISPLSKNEVSFLQEKFPNIKNLITYLPFGVDSNFWISGDSKDNNEDSYFLSIGNDSHRDYETLIESWKIEYPVLKIVTRRNIEKKIPSNIEIIRGGWAEKFLSDIEIRNLIQGSLCVIISLKETIQPSGQSVCLEAMSCGKIVLMSKVSGLWDSALMRSKENCLLVASGSVGDIREKVDLILRDRKSLEYLGQNARRTVVDNFTIQHTTDKLEEIIQGVVEKS